MIFAGFSLAQRVLGAIPFWVYPAAALLLAYGCSNLEASRAKQKLAKAAESAAVARAVEEAKARQVEQALVAGAGKVANELSVAQQAASADRRSSAERLRNLAAAWAASAASSATGATCRSDDTPTIGIIHPQVGADLEQFAQDAEDTRLRLQACQALVRNDRSIQIGR